MIQLKATKIIKTEEGYIKSVSDSLVCDSTTKRLFIRDLRSKIHEYTQENEEAGIKELIAVFGSPEEIAEDFLNIESPDELRKTLSVKRAVIIAAATAVILFVSILLASLIDANLFTPPVSETEDSNDKAAQLSLEEDAEYKETGESEADYFV